MALPADCNSAWQRAGHHRREWRAFQEVVDKFAPDSHRKKDFVKVTPREPHPLDRTEAFHSPVSRSGGGVAAHGWERDGGRGGCMTPTASPQARLGDRPRSAGGRSERSSVPASILDTTCRQNGTRDENPFVGGFERRSDTAWSSPAAHRAGQGNGTFMGAATASTAPGGAGLLPTGLRTPRGGGCGDERAAAAVALAFGTNTGASWASDLASRSDAGSHFASTLSPRAPRQDSFQASPDPPGYTNRTYTSSSLASSAKAATAHAWTLSRLPPVREKFPLNFSLAKWTSTMGLTAAPA
eukprot:TRINITY_DN6342_c0_g2_i2.p1 TRINITY_DN6342_c0_g2~~TRINITY_DN6342_c0_g2_i2.p1  ORF type:complete len:298 (+),score=31.16 TRINITY_DN6342_c0_g2_i2:98-991(+)